MSVKSRISLIMLLALAMAELLPAEKLQDILVLPNKIEPNNPLVEMVKAGFTSGNLLDQNADGQQGEAGQVQLSPLAHQVRRILDEPPD